MNIYMGALLHGLWYVPSMVVGCFLAAKFGKKNQFWGVISALIITISLSIGSLSFKWIMDMNTEYSVQNDATKRIAFWLELVPPMVAAAIVLAFKKRIRGEDTAQNEEKV